MEDYSKQQSEDEDNEKPVQAISHEPIPLPPPPNCQPIKQETKEQQNQQQTQQQKEQQKTQQQEKNQQQNTAIVVEKPKKEFKPMANNNEELIHLLDDAERRVAQLRFFVKI